MSKFNKSLERLLRRPSDFRWSELQMIMVKFGYKEIKGSGSRRKFIHDKTKVTVSLHKPHPKPTLKMYAIDIIIEHLKEEGFI